MACLIGLDLGTSSVKAVVYDAEGGLLASAAREYDMNVPQIGYAEQDPEIWWLGVKHCLAEALEKAGVPAEEIKGIGISGQMHGLVPLDREKHPIRQAILHCDVRSTGQVERLGAALGDRLSQITYNPVFPGFQLVSLMWMRDEEPEKFGRIAYVVCPKDYIRYRLTGELGAEATDASGTLAYDMVGQDWAPDILTGLDLDPAFFPDCRHLSYEVAGAVTELAARETGLRAGTPVVYGGGDQAMHSLGNGVYQPGTMTVTIGTSGQVLCITDSPVFNPELNTHTFRHVERDKWYGLGAMLSAGVTLSWFRRNVAPGASFDELDELAGREPPCADGLAFFPCMMGERTPYMDASTRGIFLGLSLTHTRGSAARAIMEGVAFALRDSVDILDRLYPGEKRTICAGGGATSPVWRQIQADVFGREVYVSKTPEQACTGAAIAAGVGCGVFSSVAEGCAQLVKIGETPTQPIPENVEKYNMFYHRVYRRLYTQNRELLAELSAM